MGRILNQRTFQVSPSIRIDCVSEKTSYAFRHLATIYKNNQQVGFGRIPYQNRTWERFEFESVMRKAVDNSSLTPQEKAEVKKWLEGDRTDWSGFKTIGMVAKMGDILATTPKEKNVWKTRMLKAGLGNQGLEIPEDWESLPEKTKTARLDKVIGLLGDVGNKGKKSNVWGNMNVKGYEQNTLTGKTRKKKSTGKLNIPKETKVWD